MDQPATTNAMKGISRRLLAVLALAASACGDPVLEAIGPRAALPRDKRPFTVDSSGRILDSAGRDFVVKGINVNGPGHPWRRETSEDADAIARTWRFNLVRAVSQVRPALGAEGTNDPEALVSAFTSRGVVVLFAPRDGEAAQRYYPMAGSGASGPTVTRAELIAWHQQLASRYRSNPFVWLELMSRPGTCEPDAEWLESHREVLSAIRKTGNRNIVVAHGWTWGGDDACGTGRSAIETYGPSLLGQGAARDDRLVFAFSAHWNNRGPASPWGSYLDRLGARNLPVIVGEYGGPIGESSGDRAGEDITATIDDLLQEVVPRGIGRVAAHWYAGEGDAGNRHRNALTTAGNGTTGAAVSFDPTGPVGAPPTNLSWLGAKVWRDTHEP